MDNTGDNELRPTSTNYDVICSRDGTIPTEVNPCYELRTSVIKGARTNGTKEVSNNTKFNSVDGDTSAIDTSINCTLSDYF